MNKINDILVEFFKGYGGNGVVLADAFKEHLENHNYQIIEKSDNYGYMCKTDFDHELGYASGGNVVYPSLEDLKNRRTCWSGCGVVKVNVQYIETVVEEDDTFGE